MKFPRNVLAQKLRYSRRPIMHGDNWFSSREDYRYISETIGDDPKYIPCQHTNFYYTVEKYPDTFETFPVSQKHRYAGRPLMHGENNLNSTRRIIDVFLVKNWLSLEACADGMRQIMSCIRLKHSMQRQTSRLLQRLKFF